MPKSARVNLRLEEDLLQRVKEYAKQRRVSVSALVEAHFRELVEVDAQERAVVPTLDAEQI